MIICDKTDAIVLFYLLHEKLRSAPLTQTAIHWKRNFLAEMKSVV